MFRCEYRAQADLSAATFAFRSQNMSDLVRSTMVGDIKR